MILINIVLLIIATVTLTVLCYSTYCIKNLEDKLRSFQERLSQHRSDMALIQQNQKGNIHRFEQVEAHVEQVQRQQDVLEQNQHVDSAYKQALKMVEIGANLEDIMSTCSLSRAEAQLLLNLHGYKATKA